MHIVENHPDVEPFFALIPETIRIGRRRQDPFDPNGYYYYRAFPDLPDDNTHMVVCVRFRWPTDPDGTVHGEKFVTTAYLQMFEE